MLPHLDRLRRAQLRQGDDKDLALAASKPRRQRLARGRTGGGGTLGASSRSASCRSGTPASPSTKPCASPPRACTAMTFTAETGDPGPTPASIPATMGDRCKACCQDRGRGVRPTSARRAAGSIHRAGRAGRAADRSTLQLDRTSCAGRGPISSRACRAVPANRFGVPPRAAPAGSPTSSTGCTRTYTITRPGPGQDIGSRLPSQVFRDNILTCFIADPFGVKNRQDGRHRNIAWECDYPHSGLHRGRKPPEELARRRRRTCRRPSWTP